MASDLSLPLAAPGFPLSSEAGSVGASGLVPNIFPVALAGIPYFLDHTDGPGLRYQSAARIRQQADASVRPGEQSLNPEGDWRRSFQDWSLGAGQSNADRSNSLANRFRSSKGVNVWTEWCLTLLPETIESQDASGTNLELVVAGARLYLADGQDIYYSTDPTAASPTWTAATGEPAADIVGLASTGYYVLAGFGASGIYLSDTSTGAFASWITGTIDGVWLAKNRIIATNGADVYNVTTSYSTAGPTALPAVAWSHTDDQWTWTDITEGLNHIYLGGFSGDKSQIYRVTIKDDATALDDGVVAASLPDGEIIRSLYGYLGFLCIGTDKGVRLATQDANGDLTYGPLLETGSAVRDFEGQGRFVWFTWEDYDATSGGLGRMDLANFTSSLAPAYASDLMTTTSADVTSVVTFDDKRLFCVAADGCYSEGTDLVASGTLDSGTVDFGLTEHKLAKSVRLSTGIFDDVNRGGSVTVGLSVNEGVSFADLDPTVVSGNITVIDAGEELALSHELRLTLTPDATTATLGPKVSGLTLRVHPHTDATNHIVARLLMNDVNQVESGYYLHDTGAILTSIRALHTDQTIVTFQSLKTGYSVTVEDFDFAVKAPDVDRGDWGGTMTVRLKVV